MTLPGQSESRFQLTSALTRYQRDNIGGYIAASSDPGSYGEITVLRFPTNVTTPGPAQIQQIFRSDQAVQSQITLLGPQNVKYGNLLTLPLESGLLYVEPLYVAEPGRRDESLSTAQPGAGLVRRPRRPGIEHSGGAGGRRPQCPGDGADRPGDADPGTTATDTTSPSDEFHTDPDADDHPAAFRRCAVRR